jgi:hypothetical protein
MKTKHGGLNNQDANVKNFSIVKTDFKKHVKVEILARDHVKNGDFRARRTNQPFHMFANLSRPP